MNGSSQPPDPQDVDDDDEVDEADDFLREVARVDEVPPPSARPGLGEHIAHFRVLGELGRGGMGVALRVFDTVMRRQLAMKVLANDPSLGDDERRHLKRRFIDEARVTGCLDHQGIVPVYDLHAEPGGRIVGGWLTAR